MKTCRINFRRVRRAAATPSREGRAQRPIAVVRRNPRRIKECAGGRNGRIAGNSSAQIPNGARNAGAGGFARPG